jgi:hypothetical protein
MDSSYFRVIFPVRKLNIRIWQEGCDTVAKCEDEGENVSEVGVLFVYI